MEQKKSFKNFVNQCSKISIFGETPVQDFCDDFANSSISNSREFKTWRELKTHLIVRRACPEAIKAGKKVWAVWHG